MPGKRNEENKKKGRNKKVIACVVTVAVLGTAGSIVYSKNRRPTDNKSEKGEAKSTEVTLGNISDTIIGTGNLELDEAQAVTISPDENMCLSVSVDELDINSVEKGQKAVVTFDAIEDKEFEGEVTEIGNSASVNGGVAKYTVEITIPKDDEMKVGMNASATITTEERNQVLTLPMNALQEQGDKTFVYTEKNTDGTLSGEVEIQTGMTDGNTVEITDGLEEGDTVYYMRSENSSSGSGSDMQNKMPGGEQAGEMPDMGNSGKGNADGNVGGSPGGGSGGGPGGGQGGPGM
nr:HlyD family efflux transporter periplasmic adaptor subunit [uncultured Blautia sp.]